MRLIDADALIAEYDRVHIGPPGGARKLIEDAPTIEPETHEERTETRACDLERWVPCSERPPEEDGEYFVTVKYGYDGGYEEVFVDSMDWHKGHWSNFFFSHPGMVESILAWMPFPKPYENEGRT